MDDSSNSGMQEDLNNESSGSIPTEQNNMPDQSTISRSLVLPSWTPQTTRILEAGGPTAWNVLDHAIDGTAFVDSLQTEMETSQILNKLRPARTAMTVQLQNALNNMVPIIENDASRGDQSTFIPRQERNRVEFQQGHPCLCRLIQSVETTVVSKMSHVFLFDTTMTSVQLAVYPGDAKSGYVRHVDCQSIPSTDTARPAVRLMTAVYYATPHDWDAVMDGGALRIFDHNKQHFDVVPHSNRLVVFCSNTVQHQVMPSLRRKRMAITIWLYGWIKEKKSHLLPLTTLSLTTPTMPTETTSLPENNIDIGIPPLPIVSNDNTNDGTIFVSIASYRDSELGPTLTSLMTTAQHAHNIFVGVVLQWEKEDHDSILSTLPVQEAWFQSNVRILSMEARHAQGPCYARHLCQTLYKDETFVLQIDSHMRFRYHWDTYLIQQLQSCPKKKSVLTTYPVGYQLSSNSVVANKETRGTLLVPWKFQNGMLRQTGRLLQYNPKECIPCHLYAAGFNFAHASIIKEVPYLPLRDLFFGEEISMAVRLYTHGYDMYAPPQSVCFHLWSRDHRPLAKNQFPNRKASLEVVRQQLRGTGPGLGTVRTVDEFAQVLGVDFEQETIVPSAKLGGLSENDFASSSILSPEKSDSSGVPVSLDPKAQAIIASFLGSL